jgi:hypothetical protein
MDEEKEILRAWVMGGPKEQFGASPEGWVRLEVTSAVLMEGEMSSNNFQNFSLDTTIADVKVPESSILLSTHLRTVIFLVWFSAFISRIFLISFVFFFFL